MGFEDLQTFLKDLCLLCFDSSINMLEEGRDFFSSTIQLCAFVGFLLFQVVLSQISLGSKLSLAEDKLWVSPNGDFALGFFNRTDQPNQYGVGIRFNANSIPVAQRKVVWVAGADVTVGCKSYFQLTQNGELVLFDSSKGYVVWTSKTSRLSVASAVLQDSGNLVLLSSSKKVVWRSFDTPSDTILPGQNLPVHHTLRAASRNSISSYYTFGVNASGQLYLKWETDVIYWTSGSSYNSDVSAVLTLDGSLQLRDNKSKPVWSVYGGDHNDSINYRFLRLDVDGNLHLYSWVEASKSWRSVWQAVENQCDVFATCNPYGICVFTSSGSPVCKCPFTATTETNAKCLVPYQPNCEQGNYLMLYEHTFLYGIYPPNDSVITSSLEQCKSLCLSDPRCTAVTYTNDGTAKCRMKNTRYVTGSLHPSLRSVSFVKTCSDPVAVIPKFPTSSPPQSPPKKTFWFCVRCQIGVVSATFVVFILIQLGICFCFYKRGKYIRKKSPISYPASNSKGLISLSYAEIEEITEKFKHQMGQEVYKGILPNKHQVAVRNLKAAIEERKFRSAVVKIGSIRHKNLLKLEGYCCDAGHRYLVYEFVKNDSLNKYMESLKQGKTLTWRKRIDLCLSVARVVSYLHSGCREFFCHGNLKWQNVVLDENLEAKVGEFGIIRLQDEASCDAGAAEKDVRDFGKMIITLVSGRPEDEDVCEWAYSEWTGGQVQRLVDEVLQEEGGVDIEELERVMRIAFWCLQVDEGARPSIGEVVKVLEGTLTVDPPPPPFVCRRPSQEGALELGWYNSTKLDRIS